MVVLASATAVAMVHAGCGGSDSNTSPSGGGGSGTGGSGPGPGATTGGGGTGGTSTTTTSNETGGSASTGGSGPGTGGTTTTSGLGGFGGAAAWPDCNNPPINTASTIPQIWSDDDTATPNEVWVPGIYVTAVSGQDCVDGTACQIFIQQDPLYATIGAAEKHGIKLFVSKRTAMHFTGIAVGDKVNVYGHAWRSMLNGQNELMIEVTLANPGCFVKVPSADVLVPIPLTKLEDVVKEKYEDVGPLFVEVTATPRIHGKPKTPAATFGIIDNSLDLEAGTDQLISLSPTFLTGSAFTGLTTGMTTHFDHVIGVYGLFVPPGQSPPVTKYKEIYVRETADYPHD